MDTDHISADNDTQPEPPAHDEPPRFPIEVFPGPLRAFVVAGSASARVPVEMVAAPFLAFHGADLDNARYEREYDRRYGRGSGDDTPHEAHFDRIYTTDPTIDVLVHDLQHGPGIAIVRDELVGVVRAMMRIM